MSPGEAALLQKAQRMNAEEWSHHCPELAPRTSSFSEIYLTHEQISQDKGWRVGEGYLTVPFKAHLQGLRDANPAVLKLLAEEPLQLHNHFCVFEQG